MDNTIDMNTNEKGLITKVREIDAQNKSLLEEASSQQNEALFYKDKSRKLEIQLNQAIGNERVLNENLATLEMANSKLRTEVDRLNQYGKRRRQSCLLLHEHVAEVDRSELVA